MSAVGGILDQFLSNKMQLGEVDGSISQLREVAADITNLLGFVSLNMAAIRKILKKYAKHAKPLETPQGMILPPPPSHHWLGCDASWGSILYKLFLSLCVCRGSFFKCMDGVDTQLKMTWDLTH